MKPNSPIADLNVERLVQSGSWPPGVGIPHHNDASTSTYGTWRRRPVGEKGFVTRRWPRGRIRIELSRERSTRNGREVPVVSRLAPVAGHVPWGRIVSYSPRPLLSDLGLRARAASRILLQSRGFSLFSCRRAFAEMSDDIPNDFHILEKKSAFAAAMSFSLLGGLTPAS